MDTGWLGRLGHSPTRQDLSQFGAYLAGSPEAGEWYLNTLEALPNPNRWQERLPLVIQAIQDRANSRHWRFDEGQEAFWLNLLCKSESGAVELIVGDEGLVVMVGAYLSLSRQRRRQFRRLCKATSDLPEIAQEVLSALPSLGVRSAASKPKSMFPRMSPAASALLVACVVAVFGVYVGWREYVSAHQGSPYTTALGEHRQVELPDGSVVDLNTATTLKYHATENHRVVELSAGEARFRLARDAARRFVVLAGTWVICDIGTEYEVRLHTDGQVEVAVFEGEVLMSRRILAGPVQRAIEGATLRYEKTGFAVHAGQMFVPRQGGQGVEWMSPAEIGRRNAWREGKLDFTNASLTQIVAELNRYNRLQFVIVDPSIAGVRLGGIFAPHEIPRLLNGLRYSGVRYRTVRTGDDIRFELFREVKRDQ